MTQPIIVAVDPRREDVAPAALGARLARVLEAPLVLTAAYLVDLSIENLDPDHARTLAREAEDALERVAARVSRGGVSPTTTAIPDGRSPARALHALAEREDAQLLVVGSSQRGPVGRVAPTAVTDRLLHGAPCAVAVAPGSFPLDGPDLALIGVGYVDRPDGDAALAFAERLAAPAHVLVRVLSVAEPPPAAIDVAVEPMALEYVGDAREETARMALEQALDRLPRERSGGGELLFGKAADALAGASKDVDLLVCGSRDHGPVRSLLLGSTSHALVRRADCPVVVVPPARASAHGSGGDRLAAVPDEPHDRR